MPIYGNTTATTVPQSDWAQTDSTKADYIKNKPIIPEGGELPVASADTLGGVKVGEGLTINNGVLSATTSEIVNNGVSTWNNRQGDVVPEIGDYTLAMVGANILTNTEIDAIWDDF